MAISTEAKTPENNRTVGQIPAPVDYLNEIDSQEIRPIVAFIGIYIRGANEPWSMTDKVTGEVTGGDSAWIQILQKQSDDSARMKIMTIKVSQDQISMIGILNKSHQFRPITLYCEVREFRKQVKYHLSDSQPALDMKKVG